MVGWWVLAALLALVIVRASRVPEGRLAGGALLIALGVWLILGATSHGGAYRFHYAPDLLPLLVGTWLVVKGALTAASY
jgi:uncharacterized membrane protein